MKTRKMGGRERQRECPQTTIRKIKQKNNFSEKIFLLKSSVGKKERTQFALSDSASGEEEGGFFRKGEKIRRKEGFGFCVPRALVSVHTELKLFFLHEIIDFDKKKYTNKKRFLQLL